MKVLLISDFGLHHTSGGAQRSNDIIIQEGIKRGHEIDVVHYDTDVSFLVNGSYDCVISSNLEAITQVKPYILDFIMRAKNHVRLEHDSNLYWNNEFRKKFWQTCSLSFFLTEFHYEFFKEMYGDFFVNVKIVPDPIDECFFDMNMERSGIGYVGFMHPLKGTDNFIKYVRDNPDLNFKVAAWGSDLYKNELTSIQNVDFLGKLDHEDMPIFYNSIEDLFYQPECKEPFCRSVGEAILCGVKNIIGGRNVGSLYEFKKDPLLFKSICLNAHEIFWKEIEECQ